MKTLIILPTQLFEDNILIDQVDKIYIIEEPFYFTYYPFHKQKLVLHRATMQNYKDFVKKYKPKYIEYDKVNKSLYKKIYDESDEIHIYDPIDHPIIDMYNKIFRSKIHYHDTPAFLETNEELDNYREERTNKKRYFHDNSFYKWQRKRLNILMDNDKPLYDKWSFDKENRNPYDKNFKELPIKTYDNKYIKEACKYVERNFSDNFGEVDDFYYPITFIEARKHFKEFLNKKLETFGKYEDGMSDKVVIGSHSNISALLNIGLLTPKYVINETIKVFNKSNNKKELISSVEGFVRQIIGWRSYMRFVYKYHGKDMLKENFFNNKNKLSKSWYDATTNIPILDDLIKKAKKYAYLHHIERLMYMGNFALLNMVQPKEIYEWFMICFIDSYEWVMINVPAMSQYSTESFTMMTRPYFSSSNYIKKMSNYKDSNIIIKKKEVKWMELWNALYYNFINTHKTKLKKIYATAMQVKYLDKLENKSEYFKLAKIYIDNY